MTGVMGLSSGRVKANVYNFCKRVVEEDIRSGLRSKFMQRVRSKPWITQTAKDTMFGVIGRSPE